MTAGGGGQRRTEAQRAQWAACYADGLASRRAAKAAGMTAARKWREEHRPVAAEGHMPFPVAAPNLANRGAGMTANRSTAVMQRRRVAPDSLDYFPTPPFATRALCEFLIGQGLALDAMICWEPACGEGHMARPLREYFGDVVASDVHRYGDDHELFDFVGLCGAPTHTNRDAPDFVITNPPFRLCADFIASAAAIAEHGFAMLVRSAFLEAAERYERIWSKNPPSYVLQFCERVVMLEGRLVRRGAVDPFAEKEGTTASSATAYCWLVWLRDLDDWAKADTRLRWLAPCMARLERPGDYPDYPLEILPPPVDGLFGREVAA